MKTISKVQETDTGEYRVTFDDDSWISVPDNPQLYERRKVQEWLDGGGVLDPPILPPAPLTEEELDAALAEIMSEQEGFERLMFEVVWRLFNRVQALEGKGQVTKPQLLNGIVKLRRGIEA